MTKWVGLLALVPPLFAGCATLTPKQADGLTEAQRFADEVTTAYGLRQVRVLVDDRQSAYWDQAGWVTIEPRFLAGDDQPVVLALLLGHAHARGRPKTIPCHRRRGLRS